MFNVPQAYASHVRSLRPCRKTLLTIPQESLSVMTRFEVPLAYRLTGIREHSEYWACAV